MASSPDDEENRTLGLPPGALEKILRDKEREKSRDRERLAAAPPGKPSSGEPVARPQPPPRTPPSNTAPAAPKWDPLDDGGSDMRTIPPARTGRNRREIPSLDAWRDSQELSPPPQGPPSKLDAPEAFQGTGPSQARPPLGPGWPSADTGQSLPSGKWPEREGLETALLPHQKSRCVPKCRHPRLAGLTSRCQTHGAVRHQPGLLPRRNHPPLPRSHPRRRPTRRPLFATPARVRLVPLPRSQHPTDDRHPLEPPSRTRE